MTAAAQPLRIGPVRRVLRFAAVGGAGFVVDVVLFNVLRDTVWAPERVAGGVLVAKAVSTLCAIGVSWVGNRSWAFRDRRRRGIAGEGVMFLVASAAGMAVGLGCLWCSHDLLGLTTALDDNVASNGVGLVLGTAVRFLLYRTWVYRDSA
jgi:putative flippase GtrA